MPLRYGVSRAEQIPPSTPQMTGGVATVARSHPRRRRVLAAVFVVALLAAGSALVLTGVFTHSASSGGGAAAKATTTSLVTVLHQDLSSQTSMSGTLGYAGSFNVVNQASGAFTALPAVGQVIRQGQVLCAVNGNPVVLLTGSIPDYRTMVQGMRGLDVAQLNTDLLALGDGSTAGPTAGSDTFTAGTAAAVATLQRRVGAQPTGVLGIGQVIFLPSAARITTVSAALGSSAQAGANIATSTSPNRDVTVDLDAAEQSQINIGDHVVITLPNNTTTPGVVTAVGAVATTPASGGSPTITVDISPTRPAATGTLDQAPVQVAITTAGVQGVLVVPVNALLALSGGGYAVEAVTAAGIHQLLAVTVGLFDDADGLVQVSGPRLAAGQRVVVPTA
jgi:hypothetical protein